MLEKDMMSEAYCYFASLKEYKIVTKEVPFLSRCIDIVMIDSNNNIISVELKIKKWRHAIEQAINHKLGADRSYICLPRRSITDSMLQALSSSGVGLMLFDKDNKCAVYEAVPASKVPSNVEAFKRILMANIYKISQENNRSL